MEVVLFCSPHPTYHHHQLISSHYHVYGKGRGAGVLMGLGLTMKTFRYLAVVWAWFGMVWCGLVLVITTKYKVQIIPPCACVSMWGGGGCVRRLRMQWHPRLKAGLLINMNEFPMNLIPLYENCAQSLQKTPPFWPIVPRFYFLVLMLLLFILYPITLNISFLRLRRCEMTQNN